MSASHSLGRAKLHVWLKNCKRVRKKARQGLTMRRKSRRLGLAAVETKCPLLRFGARFGLRRRAHSRDPRRRPAAGRDSDHLSL